MQVEAGRPAEAAALCREALQANPDDWGMLQTYLDCLLPATRPAQVAAGRHPAAADQPAAALDKLSIADEAATAPVHSEVSTSRPYLELHVLYD